MLANITLALAPLKSSLVKSKWGSVLFWESSVFVSVVSNSHLLQPETLKIKIRSCVSTAYTPQWLLVPLRVKWELLSVPSKALRGLSCLLLATQLLLLSLLSVSSHIGLLPPWTCSASTLETCKFSSFTCGPDLCHWCPLCPLGGSWRPANPTSSSHLRQPTLDPIGI